MIQHAVSARDALDGAVTALGAAGCETPRLDAEVMLAHALGVGRLALLADLDRPVQGPAVRAFQSAVRRRSVDREPVAYITGRRAFRHLELAVDARVLIPRPETELLVEVGLELPDATRVHDAGTGSGAVALALKHERPGLIVSASDASRDALAVAIANRDRLGLDVPMREDDLARAPGEAEVVLCNPPYVAETERGALAPELRHEPADALFAGPDGLAAIRRLAAGAAAWTGVRGLAVEVGAGQAAPARGLLAAAGFGRIEVREDLAGVERVVVAWRR
ncbi:MAG: peptide chain release factor N(5)-glutamine methyltransferase [Actinobacteria bacterium]|nr:MAG: peptide chain release factor N(5)-glutamine methyltransferase [Actinomycetota bacterium]